jgi:thiamine biosynthesis lipoprotein
MTLDAEHHTVTFAVKGMSLDLGGIAKGYAAEEAEQTLLKLRVKSAIVACGGEIRCIGSRPGGRPFRIGIQSPTPGGKGGLRYVVDVVNSDVSTSGNYIQFSMIGGKMYSHIIDPRTGMSIEALPSVTVVGPDGTYCDALTKPIIILGEKEGLAFLERANRELIPAR